MPVTYITCYNINDNHLPYDAYTNMYVVNYLFVMVICNINIILGDENYV